MATGLNITNQPAELSLTNFLAVSDRYGSLAKNCRFIVRIMPIGRRVLSLATSMNELTYLCDAAEFPGRGMDLMAPRYYGPEFNLPTKTKYPESINLSIICRSESNERKLFDDWMDIINPINNFNFEYRDNYVARIDVFQFAEYADVKKATAPKAVYQWSLHDAWLMEIAETQVTWADTADIQRLSVSFTYRYWSRPTIRTE